MAKLTIEEAKVKMLPVEKAIEGLKSMGLEVPPSLQQEFDRLSKIISGNSSVNVANFFNEKIAVGINKNQDGVNAIESIGGKRGKLTWEINTAEDGTKTIAFSASTGGGGGKTAGTSTGGGTKAATPYNKYVVGVTTDNANANDYAEKTGTFETASKAVEYILNGGKNPMNLGAEWQKGNSMVRALQNLQKNEVFAKAYTLECSYVEPVKKAAEPAVAETTA